MYDLQHLPRSGELRLRLRLRQRQRLRGCRASHVLRVVRAEASGAAPIGNHEGCPAPLSNRSGRRVDLPYTSQRRPGEKRGSRATLRGSSRGARRFPQEKSPLSCGLCQQKDTPPCMTPDRCSASTRLPQLHLHLADPFSFCFSFCFFEHFWRVGRGWLFNVLARHRLATVLGPFAKRISPGWQTGACSQISSGTSHASHPCHSKCINHIASIEISSVFVCDQGRTVETSRSSRQPLCWRCAITPPTRCSDPVTRHSTPPP